jgi:hypothetical protein
MTFNITLTEWHLFFVEITKRKSKLGGKQQMKQP